jgi:hypothetical protein
MRLHTLNLPLRCRRMWKYRPAFVSVTQTSKFLDPCTFSAQGLKNVKHFRTARRIRMQGRRRCRKGIKGCSSSRSLFPFFIPSDFRQAKALSASCHTAATQTTTANSLQHRFETSSSLHLPFTMAVFTVNKPLISEIFSDIYYTYLTNIFAKFCLNWMSAVSNKPYTHNSIEY